MPLVRIEGVNGQALAEPARQYPEFTAIVVGHANDQDATSLDASVSSATTDGW